MPKRRGLSGGLHAGFTAASDVFGSLLANRMRQGELVRRQEAEDARRAAEAASQAERQIAQLVMEGKIAPSQASAFLEGKSKLDFARLAPVPKAPSTAEQFAPVLDRIGEATFTEDVPADQEIFATLRPDQKQIGSFSMHGSAINPQALPPELAQSLQASQGARGRLVTRRETPQERFANKAAELQGERSVLNDPGVIAADANRGRVMSRGTAQGQADVEYSTPVIQGKARTAGASAGASENARLGVQQQRGVGEYKPPTPDSAKPPTPDQKKATGYFLRAAESHNSAMSAETAVPYEWGGFRPNISLSAENQRFKQARREFVAAVLRRDSGAAITPDEERLYGEMFFAVPGDNGATIESKRQSRINALEALRYEGGNAVTELEGARGRAIDIIRDPVKSPVKPKPASSGGATLKYDPVRKTVLPFGGIR
jgi:hypothetical protein